MAKISRILTSAPHYRRLPYHLTLGQNLPRGNMLSQSWTEAVDQTKHIPIRTNGVLREFSKTAMSQSMNGGPAQTLTAVEEFTTTFSGLMAISLFGASVAWSSIFSAPRGDLVLFSWAATCFVLAGVFASGMGMMIREQDLQAFMDRPQPDKPLWSKPLRATVILFVVISGALDLGGITLMSVAVMNLDRNGGDRIYGLDTSLRKHSNRIAGAVTIILSLFFTFISAFIVWVHKQKFRRTLPSDTSADHQKPNM